MKSNFVPVFLLDPFLSLSFIKLLKTTVAHTVLAIIQHLCKICKKSIVLAAYAEAFKYGKDAFIQLLKQYFKFISNTIWEASIL